MNDFDPNRTILRLPRRVDIINAEQSVRDGSGYDSWEIYRDLTLTPDIVHCPDTGDRGRLMYREDIDERAPQATTMIDGAAMLRAGVIVLCVLSLTAWVW